jgi:uncharacterized protein YeaO (DUF488 family)
LRQFKGKAGPAVDFETYATRYFQEMQEETFRIRALRDRLADGETITLLCSSACKDPARCHRTLLKGILEKRARG